MYILCRIFRESINSIIPFMAESGHTVLPWKNHLNIEPSEELEKVLTDVVNLVIGFSFDGRYDYSEVRVCFDNIIRNIPFSNCSNIYDIIHDYKNRYVRLLNDNYYVNLFVKVVKKIYSPTYDGKLGDFNKNTISSKTNNAHIGILGNSITIGKPSRIGEDDFPFIQIHDAMIFNDVLQKFIETLKNSNSPYNLYNVPNFVDFYSDDELIKLIFEAIILNASVYELANVSKYFIKYTDFLNDQIMPSLNNLTCIGEEFGDEIFFKTKRSDIEYETPYYFAFMLKNHRFELPNVRLSITNNEFGEKLASIITVQSSQITRTNVEISDIIKKKTPKTSAFRFYNPDNFISLIISFGILNGLGIYTIDVQDFMPIRYRKTVLDTKMNENEAEDYIKRVFDKNIACYYKMVLLTDDIEILSNIGCPANLQLKTSEMIHFDDAFLQNLYMMGFNYGRTIRSENLER